MKRTVHLVPHTHWDREWYFNSNQSKVLLLETLAVVLTELESGDLPCFVLDGQTALIEDYLQFEPTQKSRITALVKAGKLHIGPWYSQTDQCVVGAESITRNLLYGIRDCRQYGGHMKVGYVPDSFGQTAQLPQILNGFDLHYCVFWRGLSDAVSEKTEFNWSSADGSSVTTAVIQGGYSGAKGMPEDDELHEHRFTHLQSHVDFLAPFNHSDLTLLMCGNDQQPWDPRWPDLLTAENKNRSDIEYKWSDIPGFFTALEQREDLGEVCGEMLAGKYSRIHRGIYSTRYDIKKLNADAENLITNTLEPILSIGWTLGFEYPHGLLECVWKNLLKSHAHDSIGCCNSDEVNQAVKRRFTDAIQISREQLALRIRQISARIISQQTGDRLVVFNTLPEIRNELVTVEVLVPGENPNDLQICDAHGDLCDFQVLSCEARPLSTLVQDIAAVLKPGESGDPMYFAYSLLVDAPSLPALGYTTLYLQSSGNNQVAIIRPEKAQNHEIENEYLRVSLDFDGTIKLTHLGSGQTMTGLLEFVDGGDDGDNYDFSPPRMDQLISTIGTPPQVRVEYSKLQSVMTIDYTLTLPVDLSERAAGIGSSKMKITASLELKRGQDFVEVQVEVDNVVRDHRLQAIFRTGLETDVSYADQPFGMICRSAKPAELEDWIDDNWTSKPLPLYPMQSLVALTDEAHGFAVITDGIREYELRPDLPGYLAITLFRSVGTMGKPDLLYRPGRLSGMPMATPDSQIQGPLQFRFALTLFTGRPAKVTIMAKRFLSPVIAFHDNGLHRFSINRGFADLPDHFSLVEWQTPLVISAVKKAEDKEALVIRAYNPGDSEVDSGQLKMGSTNLFIDTIQQVNLNENTVSEADAGYPSSVVTQQVIGCLLTRTTKS